MHYTRTFLFTLTLCSAWPIYAQDSRTTMDLGEVTVKAAKTIQRADGQSIYPTDSQKKAASNGYGILQQLALPNLRIDAFAHAVTAIDGRGDVQLRINGVVVGKQEMMALNPTTISRIDFVDVPGLRYGEGVAYVVHIITQKADAGYTIAVDAASALTSRQGNGTAYAKRNKGRHELAISYDFNGYRTDGTSSYEKADYTLKDGSIHTIERRDLENSNKSLQQGIKLSYNLTDSTTSVFQASLNESSGHTPGDFSIKDIVDKDQRYQATNRESRKWHSPVLDLYYFRQLTSRQSITANTVGTYLSTRAANFYDEGTPYSYHIKGHSWSAQSEVIYENKLKPFTLSTGLNHLYKHTRNHYTDDASAHTLTRHNKVYAFADIKGKIGSLRYAAGGGYSHINYRQREHQYRYDTFRAQGSFSYEFKGFTLKYAGRLWDNVSRLAMTSDAVIRKNSMEWTVGNPDLKPNRNTDHELSIHYNHDRFNAFLSGYYKQCRHCNMAHYERTDDNRFIYTQTNQKEIDVLRLSAYASVWLIPEKLQVTAYGGLQRCFNYGHDYTHCYSAWFYACNAAAYLGKFTLFAYMDNGNKFLEGESKGVNKGQASLQIWYKHKDWQFGLAWDNPLCTKYKANVSEVLNTHLHKLYTLYNKDNGNRLTLNISWRLSKGKKHPSAQRKIHLEDTDNGIMK